LAGSSRAGLGMQGNDYFNRMNAFAIQIRTIIMTVNR
jgi:hypothetical protein